MDNAPFKFSFPNERPQGEPYEKAAHEAPLDVPLYAYVSGFDPVEQIKDIEKEVEQIKKLEKEIKEVKQLEKKVDNMSEYYGQTTPFDLFNKLISSEQKKQQNVDGRYSHSVTIRTGRTTPELRNEEPPIVKVKGNAEVPYSYTNTFSRGVEYIKDLKNTNAVSNTQENPPVAGQYLYQTEPYFKSQPSIKIKKPGTRRELNTERFGMSSSSSSFNNGDSLLQLRDENGNTFIDFKHNGDMYVRGELITVDGTLIEGLRMLLRRQKFIP